MLTVHGLLPTPSPPPNLTSPPEGVPAALIKIEERGKRGGGEEKGETSLDSNSKV